MTSPDYGDLSTAELIKHINSECAGILAGERNTFQKAIALGDALLALRKRQDHGKWQAYLAKVCPQLSYETATVYIRLADNRDKLMAAAKDKSVAPTDLTIELALKLLAKPKPEGSAKPKRAQAVDEPGDTKRGSPSTAPDEIIKDIDVDELFLILKQVYDSDQLKKLSELLRNHVSPQFVRRPLAQQPAVSA